MFAQEGFRLELQDVFGLIHFEQNIHVNRGARAILLFLRIRCANAAVRFRSCDWSHSTASKRLIA